MVEGARATCSRTSPFNYPWSWVREHHDRVLGYPRSRVREHQFAAIGDCQDQRDTRWWQHCS
eukprot:6479687-Prorocentrum_lima.AAC.1